MKSSVLVPGKGRAEGSGWRGPGALRSVCLSQAGATGWKAWVLSGSAHCGAGGGCGWEWAPGRAGDW